MYSNEEKAIKFVIKAFENKKRIKEDINLSVHSITVGFMLKSIGCDEETVISGLLHDIIEDTSFDYCFLKDSFGKKIANNVLMVSEDATIVNWKERKTAFLKKLYEQSDNIILIELADKLHNLVSDYELWQSNGSSALNSPNASYDDNKWYYLEMKKLFNTRLSNNLLLDRFNKITELYFEE